MKRVKLINDPAELVALFRAVDSEIRRNVLSTLAEGWTMISDLVEKFELEEAVVNRLMSFNFFSSNEKSNIQFTDKKHMCYIDLKKLAKIYIKKIKCQIKMNTEIVFANYFKKPNTKTSEALYFCTNRDRF